MAGTGDSGVAGNWSSARSRTRAGSSTGLRSRGFTGTRGFGKPARTAAGRVSSFRPQPFRGEEDLYSMLGRTVGDDISPFSAGMGDEWGDPGGYGGSQYNPGTGVGSGQQGYGAAKYFGTPGGMGDLGEQGSGYEPGYGGEYGGSGKDFSSNIPPGLGGSNFGISGVIGPADPGIPIDDPIYGPPGESPIGGGYMGEDYMGGGFGNFEGLGRRRQKLKPPGHGVLPGTYLPGEGIGGQLPGTDEGNYGGGQGSWQDAEEGVVQEQYESPSTMGPWYGQFGGQQEYSPRLLRQDEFCPPGDPNCR